MNIINGLKIKEKIVKMKNEPWYNWLCLVSFVWLIVGLEIQIIYETTNWIMTVICLFLVYISFLGFLSDIPDLIDRTIAEKLSEKLGKINYE